MISVLLSELERILAICTFSSSIKEKVRSL
jgi:hypothetical protein